MLEQTFEQRVSPTSLRSEFSKSDDFIFGGMAAIRFVALAAAIVAVAAAAGIVFDLERHERPAAEDPKPEPEDEADEPDDLIGMDVFADQMGNQTFRIAENDFIDYTDDLPLNNSNPLQLNDVFQLTMQNKMNIEYIGTVSLGTPPQEFKVVLDTGSDIFWVPKVNCRSHGPYARHCRNGDSVYRPKRSKTFKNTGRKFAIYYGTGSAHGKYYTDIFSFGAGNKRFVLNRRVKFGAANRMTFSDQGILGLPSKDTPSRRGSSIFHEAVAAGLLDKPIFTAVFHHCGSRSCSTGGRITFGAEDPDFCHDVEGWVNVDRNSMLWQFSVDELRVGSYHRSRSTKAITDTGTSDLVFSSGVARRIGRQLGARRYGGMWFVGCDRQFELKLTIGGHVYVIPSKQLKSRHQHRGMCELAISGGGGPNLWILGDPFLRSYCHVHNVKERKVGFARVK